MSDDFEDRPYALVVLLPEGADPVNAASSEDIAHMTFVWFGDISDDETEDGTRFDAEAIRDQLAAYAAETTPITVPVRERGVLGDDEADVLFMEGTEALMALRAGLVDPELDDSDENTPPIQAAHDAVTQYDPWTPHVTLGYPETPAEAEYAGDQIIFDRFALWIGNDRQEFPMGTTAITAAADVEVDDPEVVVEDDIDLEDEEMVDDVPAEIPVHGVAAISGKRTGDGRMFARDGVSYGTMPAPLGFEFESSHGGDNSRVAVVGRIDEMWPEDKGDHVEHRFRGVIMPGKPYGNQAIEGLVDGSYTGLSVIVDDVVLDVAQEREEFIARLKADRDEGQRAEGDEELATSSPKAQSDEEIEDLVDAFIGDGTMPLTTFAEARIRRFDAVPTGAYMEAWMALGPDFVEDEEGAAEEQRAALEACGCLGAVASEFRDYSDEERKQLADEGKALPDGSFPIADEEDLRNAIQAIGRASDPDAAKAHIKKRAKELGAEGIIPEGWGASAEALASLAASSGLPLHVLVAASTPSEFPFDTELTTAEGVDVRFSLRRAHQLDPHVAAILRSEGHQFAPGTKDGPGWITHPRATARIRRYWVRGKGAAKIAWGTPGDFNRCRSQLAKYVQNPEWLAGLCANMHKEALGIWPAQHHGLRAASAAEHPRLVLASGGYSETFPAAAFANPQLEKLTPLTITEDGRVYGHLAQWGQCHIGIQGTCVNPPFSELDYAAFKIGTVETDEGDLRVGHLTYGCGHAGGRVTAAAATAHYDRPDAVRAHVNIGEDSFGIWYAGVLRPGLTEEDRREFKALGALSGDWRDVGGGHLELVAATAVNSPGFPIIASAGGHQITLIGAGIVPAATDAEPITASAADGGRSYMDAADVAAIVRTTVQEFRAEEARAHRIAAAKPALAQFRAERVRRAKARLTQED